MQNVQRVIFERDHALVQEYFKRGKKDLEDLQLFEMMKRWFEHKWHLPFISEEIKKSRNL